MEGSLTTMDGRRRWAWRRWSKHSIFFLASSAVSCCRRHLAESAVKTFVPSALTTFVVVMAEGTSPTRRAALRAAIVSSMRDLPPRRRDLFDVTRVVLDSIPDARVTVDILVRLMVIQGRPTQNAAVAQEAFEAGREGERRYPAQAAGHEYLYRSFLYERVVDGSLQVLVDWAPTWEPSHNIQVKDLQAFHDAARERRRQRRGQANTRDQDGSD